MDSSTLRDSAKATVVFFLGIMVIAMIGARVHTGVALVFWGAVALAVALVFVVAWRNRANLGLRSLAAFLTIIAPAAVGITGIVRLVSLYRGGVPIQFTRNDMVMNSIEAMTIHMRGGLGVGDDAKPVFMTAIINSLFYGPGTEYPDLLTMLYGNIAATTAVCTVASIFGAWFAFSLLKGAPLPWRIGAALFAGWIPFTRHVFGAVMYQGYMNIPVIYLVLILAWIVFRTMRPVESMAWLALIVIITLATWSPASLIPGFLLLLALILFLTDRTSEKPTPRQIGFVLLTWFLVALYFLSISLPSLRADGSYLTAGPGGLAGDFQDHLLLAAIGLMLLQLLYGALVPQRYSPPVLGIGAMTLGGWLAVFYLASLREIGDSPWGYYPLKMLWISTVTMAMIIGTELIAQTFAPLTTREGGQFSRRMLVLLRASFATLSILVLAIGIILPSSYLGVRKTLIPMMARDIIVPSAEEKRTYDELVEIFDAHKGKAIAFWRQSEVMEFDGDRNRFLIQFSAPTDHDVRFHAYRAWDKDYYDLICPLIRDWDRDAILVTSSANLEETKNRLTYCGIRHEVEILALDD